MTRIDLLIAAAGTLTRARKAASDTACLDSAAPPSPPSIDSRPQREARHRLELERGERLVPRLPKLPRDPRPILEG